jgi:hypothetical protein
MALPAEGLNNLAYSPKTPEGESSTVHGSSSNCSMDYLANNHSTSSDRTKPQAQVSLSQDETALNHPAHEFTSSEPTGLTCTCMATVDMEDLLPLESDELLLSIYRNSSWHNAKTTAGNSSISHEGDPNGSFRPPSSIGEGTRPRRYGRYL